MHICDVPLVLASRFFLSCLLLSDCTYTTHNYLDRALTRAHTCTHTHTHAHTHIYKHTRTSTLTHQPPRQIRLVQLVAALQDGAHVVPGIRPSLLRALLRWQGKFPLCYVLSLLIGAGFILFGGKRQLVLLLSAKMICDELAKCRRGACSALLPHSCTCSWSSRPFFSSSSSCSWHQASASSAAGFGKER